ncbi:hypothetical protein N9A45_00335 [bacterium]|nr:hypothetical protein [bacterium]
MYEHVEDGVDRWSALEICLWCACIVFHIFLDVGLWSARTFYWCLLAVVCVMTLMSRHVAKLATLCAMPFALMPLALYTCLRCAHGRVCVALTDIVLWTLVGRFPNCTMN